jgi:mono/diheme cytochrome c family protein
MTAAFVLAVSSAVAWAGSPYPYFDPKKDGYNIKDDSRPWFDGKDYPFYQDMFNGKSLKPQEEGSYQKTPEGSVPVRMVLGKIEKIYDPFIPAIVGEGDNYGAGEFGHPREFIPKNPTQPNAESIARGKDLYNTYCAACHGTDGLSNTVPVQRGVPAPPIVAFFDIPTAAPHLYNKIKYGSFFQTPRGFMPAYGAQTSVEDRWDMVNYMMSEQFGK